MEQTIQQNVWFPISGKVQSLDCVEDEMFREQMLGPTICIYPQDCMVYAPFDGLITVMYPSSHAVGIKREDGLEVLIHIGIDTAALHGKGFYSQVKQGDYVAKGCPLLAFDLNFIQTNGYSIQTFIVFTNGKNFKIGNIVSNQTGELMDVLCYAERI